ncbi:MAG: divalent-cation tolerance protein CutA [Candidatus Poseidoniaceae archaeon]|jgi:periplasmic divalent cation tolerance protein|tara:strand:- start:1342 stop:1653 length:312 start_codon:yes stop_codon:yes gene_type:complete
MTAEVMRVQTTLPSDWIEAFVGEFKLNLLDAGASCVEHEAIQSMYKWEGKVQSEREWRIVTTTNALHLEAVIEAIVEHHPYEVPQLLTWPVTAHSSYAQWIHS